MPKFKPIDAYLWFIAALGLGLLGLTTALQAPKDIHPGSQVLINGAILLILTFLSSISPMQTRHGSVLTVGIGPTFRGTHAGITLGRHVDRCPGDG